MTRAEKIETFIGRVRAMEDPQGNWWRDGHSKTMRHWLDGQSDAYIDQAVAETEGRAEGPRIPAAEVSTMWKGPS